MYEKEYSNIAKIIAIRIFKLILSTALKKYNTKIFRINHSVVDFFSSIIASFPFQKYDRSVGDKIPTV